MRKFKIMSILTAGVCGAAILAGCVTKPANTDTNGTPFTVSEVSAKELQAPQYAQSIAAEQVAAGANDFAFRLSAALSAEYTGENFVCSPYSVWLPLAALLNATNDASKPALLEALGAAGISAENVNKAASRMLYDLTRLRDKENEQYDENFKYRNPLQIANAIFVDNDAKIKPEFAQAFADYYRGAAINVDFASDEAVKAVNQWASDNTEGLITDLIDKFNSATVAAIANAIYFYDRWEREFNPEKTTEDVFHAPSGDVTASYMLREGDSLTYYEDDKVQAMPLTYTSGGGLYIILPKDGDASGLLASMTDEYFREIQSDAISATGKLLLPRFSIDSDTMPLNDALKALGVPLFDPDSAPLTGVIEDNALWLSQALQKPAYKSQAPK